MSFQSVKDNLTEKNFPFMEDDIKSAHRQLVSAAYELSVRNHCLLFSLDVILMVH